MKRIWLLMALTLGLLSGCSFMADRFFDAAQVMPEQVTVKV